MELATVETDLDLRTMALFDDRRVYVKSLHEMDIIGMYRMLRDMAIILNLKDIIGELDKLESKPFFSITSLHKAYSAVLNGDYEIEFVCNKDPLSKLTKSPSWVRGKVNQLVDELQNLMGKILEAEYQGSPVGKLLNMIQHHVSELPDTINSRYGDDLVNIND